MCLVGEGWVVRWGSSHSMGLGFFLTCGHQCKHHSLLLLCLFCLSCARKCASFNDDDSSGCHHGTRGCVRQVSWCRAHQSMQMHVCFWNRIFIKLCAPDKRAKTSRWWEGPTGGRGCREDVCSGVSTLGVHMSLLFGAPVCVVGVVFSSFLQRCTPAHHPCGPCTSAHLQPTVHPSPRLPA